MNQMAVRERLRTRKQVASSPARSAPSASPGFSLSNAVPQVESRPRRVAVPTAQLQSTPITRKKAHEHIEHVRHNVEDREYDSRVQHELKEMTETEDLQDIDDDVEDLSTLYDWNALEHTHRPKSAKWFAVLAGGLTAIVAGLVLLGNLMGAITVGLLGALTYVYAQREPGTVRYRLLTEGVAFNNLLYHYRDLEAFNIIYEPGYTKTVLLRSKKTFAPLLHMEIGDTDPVAIRDILIEFLPEDQEITEPLVDIYARQLGF